VSEPFWKAKALADMSQAEWESLCDGCGKCCLQKLEDDETGRVHLTVVACRLLDVETCRCRSYATRRRFVPECVELRPDNVKKLMLPRSCAYRLLAEGKELPAWHPLVSGDARSVHVAGQSARDFAVAGSLVDEDDLQDFVVAWTV
jgi:uncharacterized cysteine cluster protein YcgN (CxxCxxCC family)